MCHDCSLADARRAFAKAVRDLTYDNARREVVLAEIKRVAWALSGAASPTPAQWVKAAERVLIHCGRCAGSGIFVTYVENGVPRGPGGYCYRCGGKGRQNAADGARNACFDTGGYYHDRNGDVRDFGGRLKELNYENEEALVNEET